MAYRDVSIVIPVAEEDLEAVQELVSSVLIDGSVGEVFVLTKGDTVSFPLAVNERLRVRQQSAPLGGKASALNDALSLARSPYTIFIDADLLPLRGDEIAIAREVLEDNDFVSAAYGARPPPFPIASFFGGWFCGCKTNTLRSLGGFENDFVEDIKTSSKIKKAGFKISALPFSVAVRRAPRRPLLKLLSAM